MAYAICTGGPLPQSTNSSRDITQAQRKFSLRAETFVANILEGQNWTILARNYRRRGSEIDIIARKGATLAFVEVKARRMPMTNLGGIEALLTPRKLVALARGARLYLASLDPQEATFRGDLAVVWPEPKKLGLLYIPDAYPLCE